MGCETLFTVQLERIVETVHVITQVGHDRRGLECVLTARIEEKISVTVAVPAGNAMAAQEFQCWVWNVFAAEDNPEIDFMLLHQKLQVHSHLVDFNVPFTLSPLADQGGCYLSPGEHCAGEQGQRNSYGADLYVFLRDRHDRNLVPSPYREYLMRQVTSRVSLETRRVQRGPPVRADKL